jgi:hypothetical protein
MEVPGSSTRIQDMAIKIQQKFEKMYLFFKITVDWLTEFDPTIYITVFVTRGRHFGAQESVLIIFFRGIDEKKY